MQKRELSKNPGYSAVHKWLARNHHRNEKCDFCSSTKFLEWALKKGKKHAHNKENYYTLCSSCHKKYDYTDERKKKLSDAMRGREILWKDKISLANKGRKLTETQRKKISEHNKQHPRPRNGKGQFFKKEAHSS